MLPHTQNRIYFERMEKSLGDKLRLVPYITGTRVLDIGAGSGSLSEFLRLDGYDVVAVDGSETAIELINGVYPDVSTKHCFANELSRYYGPGSFDTIVCSAVLHEVFSYAPMYTGELEISELLQLFNYLLKPGGRLLIRDGVMPTNSNALIRLQLSEDGSEFLRAYQSLSPHYSNEPRFRRVSFIPVSGEHVFEGTYASLMEFLYTYTWGWGSIERESKELYGVFPLGFYCDFVSEHGYEILHAEEYVQQGYVDALSPLVSFTYASGETCPYPSTNMIMVVEKR